MVANEPNWKIWRLNEQYWVITHQQLLKTVWGPGHAQDTHYVRVHMANLRKKVEVHPSMPAHVLTEAGIGYRFVP